MQLEKIIIENFRCYQSLEIDFHPNTTVLVANNGHGKTSILDAIRIALWPYISQFDLAKTAYADPANTITIDDIQTVKVIKKQSKTFGIIDEMSRRFPSSVMAIANVSGELKTWQRFRDSEAKKSQTKDDTGCRKLKSEAKNMQTQVRDLTINPIDLPLFGYYGTGRLWKEKRLTDGKKGSAEKNNQFIRTFSYRDCLDPASSFRQFEDWFTSAYMKVMESQIKQIEQGATFIEVDPELKLPVKVVQDAVNVVLKPVGWHSLQYSETYDKSLILKHDDLGVMKVSQLSDGIKNILAMIADIAYRAVLLNGHLGEDAATLSSGIVMIDEIDMHLHPMWQQTVVSSLQEAFPNIQFIVTTHSPQVLSTVPSQCIRLIKHRLDSDTNDILSTATAPDTQSRGVMSADVMAELQEVDPVPDVKEAKWVVQFKNLITQNQHNEPTGLELEKKIIEHFGRKHQVWLDCERLIRLQALKARLPVNK